MEWRSLKGLVKCGDNYSVSDAGNVKNVITGNTLKVNVNKQNGYGYVTLCCNGVKHKTTVHRLVAIAFIPNPNNLPCINHKDEFAKTDNSVSNLEWCDRRYNNVYGTARERMVATRRRSDGYKAHNAKQVAQIDKRTGKVLAVYESANEAGRILGISDSHICEVANHRPNHHTYKGYRWEWVENIKE